MIYVKSAARLAYLPRYSIIVFYRIKSLSLLVNGHKFCLCCQVTRKGQTAGIDAPSVSVCVVRKQLCMEVFSCLFAILYLGEKNVS